ncbi:hypothetical protein [Streptomyces microflavus]|uniref:hypothetical protein n=1 Tax=Streptomyces microflavus TaxID=1919 RepID=UPI003B228B0A
MPNPTPLTAPADPLRGAAYRASTSAELATLLTRLADASDHHTTGDGGVVATLVHRPWRWPGSSSAPPWPRPRRR